MKRYLHRGLRKFEIIRSYQSAANTHLKRFENKEFAFNFLQGFMGDYFNILNIRSTLEEGTLSYDLSRLTDYQVVHLLARQLAAGILRISELSATPSIGSCQAIKNIGVEKEIPFDLEVKPVARPKPDVKPVPPSSSSASSSVSSSAIRILLWNIPELGGGFFRREHLPDYAIRSFATLIAGIDADICLLMGLQRQGPSCIEKKSMPDDSPYFIAAAGTADAGVKEMDRILSVLRDIDSAGNWQVVFPKANDGTVAYQGGTTAGLLYRKKGDLAFRTLELVRGPGHKRFGVPTFMLNALFDCTTGAGTKKALPIVAPLYTMVGNDEAPVKGSGDGKAMVTVKGDMPESCLVAISVPSDLGSHVSSLNSAYRSITPDISGLKSVPERPKWAIILDAMEGLVHNPLLAAWADPKLQDEAMFWLPEDLPAHPTAPEDITGMLSDLFLQRPKSGPVQLEGLHVVDMIRASFEKKKLAEPQRPEDAVLVKLCKEHKKGMLNNLETEFRDTDISDTASSAHYARFLSDHWPVLANVTLK